MSKELETQIDITCWICTTSMIGDTDTNDEGYEIFVGYCPECDEE
tara:strand:- start:569 stop:703 length:135 start_codon:yes stop_codon:yes gene_type:complete